MVNLGDKKHCKCKKMDNIPNECINQYTISEKGKSIKLVPKNQTEKISAIIIDQCIITDNNTKCDALFLFHSNNKKISFLTELKGAGDIPKAFMQLSYTRDRIEYKELIDKFKNIDNKIVDEKFIIVSNGTMNKINQEKFEEKYNIRVRAILHSEATKPIPNLRELI